MPLTSTGPAADRAAGYTAVDVAVPGGALRLGVWGPHDPAAPTVLAVHGVSATHRAWGYVAGRLPGVRVIAPDLRGRGRSNGLPGPYGMARHADDLAAALASLAQGPVVAAGHSMGAFVCVVLAHRHPELVRSLLLVDGGLPLDVPGGMSDEQVVESVLGPVAQRLALDFPSREAHRAYWRKHPAFAEHWNDLVEDYVDYDLEGTAPHLRASTRYAALAEDTAQLHRGADLPAALAGLAHPVKLLRSPRGLFDEERGLYAPEHVAAWRARLPALVAEDVPGTNHYTIVMAVPGADVVAGELEAMLAARP